MTRKQAIAICKTILQHQANGNVRAEQAQYDKLRQLCEKSNVDFANALEGGMREAKKSIAVQMRGII